MMFVLRVEGSVFDHRASRRKAPVGGGALDERPRHPVLHASSGIRRFELGDDASRAWRHEA